MVSSRQASGRGYNDESLGRKQLSYITHPLVSVQGRFYMLQYDLSSDWNLVVRTPPPCENRASLEAVNFSVDMPFTNLVDCIASMLRAGVETYILPQNYSASWICAVTKNRTLSKPSCQVRRLSKLKSTCLIYLYSFVCSVARRVPSFVEAWLCYAHGCTFLALFLLPWPKPMAF